MTSRILALDFDGVICDGLIEYFQTAWRAYGQLFSSASQEPPAGLAERFYPLRPVVESGWEMPVLLHALLSGIEETQIWNGWAELAPRLAAEAGLSRRLAAEAVDGVRDRWIQADLEDWLSQHRFYPGVVERLRQLQASDTQLMIISTKEGRFIQRLLARENIHLQPEQIWGKEVKRPKFESLRQLRARAVSAPHIWFVEDRLAALQAVASQEDLKDVQLFLAAWGYNDPPSREQAQRDARIALLSLESFTQGSFAQQATI